MPELHLASRNAKKIAEMERILAEHVPGAEAHLFENEGHLSLVVQLDRILADLKRLGGVA